MKINNAIWVLTNSKNFLQVTFPVESRTRCEKLLNVLKSHQIGKTLGSIVSVIPCSIYYHEDDEEQDEIEEVADDQKSSDPDAEK